MERGCLRGRRARRSFRIRSCRPRVDYSYPRGWQLTGSFFLSGQVGAAPEGTFSEDVRVQARNVLTGPRRRSLRMASAGVTSWR